MSNNVFVTNENDFTHVDHFDGDEFVFPPHEKILIPIPAAIHFFGYGLKDKEEALQRIGWAGRYNSTSKIIEADPDGARKLANFVFDEAVTVSRSSLTPTDNLEIA